MCVAAARACGVGGCNCEAFCFTREGKLFDASKDVHKLPVVSARYFKTIGATLDQDQFRNETRKPTMLTASRAQQPRGGPSPMHKPVGRRPTHLSWRWRCPSPTRPGRRRRARVGSDLGWACMSLLNFLVSALRSSSTRPISTNP